MSNDSRYFICKRIDEPKRYFGLTIDEFVPIITTIILGAMFSNLLLGFVLAAIVWLAIRHFKKGQGTSWFFNLMYWYVPLFSLHEIIFLKTPRSSLRHWLG